MDDLDERVTRALDYYAALIVAGKHEPGSEARDALHRLHSVIAKFDRERAGALPS